MRTNDERQELLCPRLPPDVRCECWVNVVIVCNLKRLSDHQAAFQWRHSQERGRLSLINRDKVLFPNIFPESLRNHVLKTLIQIFL